VTTENMKSKAGKVNARYVGPFTVKRIVSAVNVELDFPLLYEFCQCFMCLS
jgi:hypothetical protein